MILSNVEENYLKIIYCLEFETKQKITTNILAELTQTKAASVSEMLQKLKKKELIDYTPYKLIAINNKGKKIGLEIIRRNRIWKTFLVKQLDFEWQEIEELADDLEHIKSTNLLKKIDEKLGYPKLDPHGKTIPNTSGQVIIAQNDLLIHLKPRDKCEVIGIADQTNFFITNLIKIGITPGISLKIIDKDPYDGTIGVFIDKKTIRITDATAQKIMVKKIVTSFLSRF